MLFSKVQCGRLLTVACLATFTAAPAAGQPDRQLPPVNVVSVDGAAAPLPSFAQDGQWLVFYMGAPGSAASTRLLEAMATWELGDGLSRILVVVADTADPKPLADAWAEKLPGVKWVGDPGNEMAKALKVRGAPTLLGARGQKINWVLAGVLNDPTMLRDVVRSWAGVGGK